MQNRRPKPKQCHGRLWLLATIRSMVRQKQSFIRCKATRKFGPGDDGGQDTSIISSQRFFYVCETPASFPRTDWLGDIASAQVP